MSIDRQAKTREAVKSFHAWFSDELEQIPGTCGGKSPGIAAQKVFEDHGS